MFSEAGCRQSEPEELARDPHRTAGHRRSPGADRDIRGAAYAPG